MTIAQAVRKSLKDTLRDLQLDYLDCYLFPADRYNYLRWAACLAASRSVMHARSLLAVFTTSAALEPQHNMHACTHLALLPHFTVHT